MIKKTFKSEADVKEAVKQLCKKYGAHYDMHQAGIYSTTGISDFTICYYSHFVAVETKFGRNKPTKPQLAYLEKIENCGGHTLVVNEKNLHELDNLLAEISGVYYHD